MNDIRLAVSNHPQDSSGEIASLINQLLAACEESIADLKRDSEVFLTRLVEIADYLQEFGESKNAEDVMGCIRQLKTLTLDRRNSEQSRAEQISKRVSLIQKDIAEAQTEVSLDALTRVADSKGFDRTLRRWVETHEKSGLPFTLAFFDLNNCRQINELFGRLVGDKILALVALELGKNIRESDFLARCGGNRFAVLSSGMELQDAAKRFLKVLSRFETIEKPIASFTASCGIAAYDPGESAGELVDRAQNALLDAKQRGKNCVATRLKATQGTTAPRPWEDWDSGWENPIQPHKT